MLDVGDGDRPQPGRVDVQQRGDTTQLQVDLRGVDPKNRWPAALEAALAIDPARLQLQRGVLRVGSDCALASARCASGSTAPSGVNVDTLVPNM